MPGLKKVLIFSLLLTTGLGFSTNIQAQRIGRKNLAGFDNKLLHFGFILSGNKSDFSFDLRDTTLSSGFLGVSVLFGFS